MRTDKRYEDFLWGCMETVQQKESGRLQYEEYDHTQYIFRWSKSYTYAVCRMDGKVKQEITDSKRPASIAEIRNRFAGDLTWAQRGCISSGYC